MAAVREHECRTGGAACGAALQTPASADSRSQGGTSPGEKPSSAQRCLYEAVSSAAEAAGKLPLARAGQFADHAAPASDGHQQCLGLAPHLRPQPGGKAEIGNDQPQSADTP
jgi:hypothetical protein